MPVQNLVAREHSLVMRRADVAEIVDLRHRVLRKGLPREEAVFEGDELADNWHFGAFDEVDHAVCCATFHRSQWNGRAAWQLRGMATDAAYRNKGVGRAVLGFAESILLVESPIRVLWCNGRIKAIQFYESLGWKIASELFDIPTAGPHYKMVKELGVS